MQQSSSGNGVRLNDEVIAEIQRLVTGKTDEALNARFGISYNTWRKLISGHSIRPSLARRLENRLALLRAAETQN